jgi:hypothetical protein
MKKNTGVRGEHQLGRNSTTTEIPVHGETVQIQANQIFLSSNLSLFLSDSFPTPQRLQNYPAL